MPSLFSRRDEEALAKTLRASRAVEEAKRRREANRLQRQNEDIAAINKYAIGRASASAAGGGGLGLMLPAVGTARKASRISARKMEDTVRNMRENAVRQFRKGRKGSGGMDGVAARSIGAPDVLEVQEDEEGEEDEIGMEEKEGDSSMATESLAEVATERWSSVDHMLEWGSNGEEGDEHEDDLLMLD